MVGRKENEWLEYRSSERDPCWNYLCDKRTGRTVTSSDWYYVGLGRDTTASEVGIAHNRFSQQTLTPGLKAPLRNTWRSGLLPTSATAGVPRQKDPPPQKLIPGHCGPGLHWRRLFLCAHFSVSACLSVSPPPPLPSLSLRLPPLRPSALPPPPPPSPLSVSNQGHP